MCCSTVLGASGVSPAAAEATVTKPKITRYNVRMFPPMEARWTNWIAASPYRACGVKSPHALMNELFGDHSSPDIAITLGEMLDERLQLLRQTNNAAPEKFCLTSRYVCSKCKGGNALPKTCCQMREELETAIQTIQKQQKRLAALERFHAAMEPWHKQAAPPAQAGSALSGNNDTQKRQRMDGARV
jgi:hypothetical protein